jgi:Arc/MetJ-type ribon-helix-helix transcriptional regulator
VYLIRILKNNIPNLAGIFTMMKEQTFELDESQIKFLQGCQNYGFKDASEVVRIAIKRLELALEAEQLEESAALYAEIYEKDTELQELTELGLEEWPKS